MARPRSGASQSEKPSSSEKSSNQKRIRLPGTLFEVDEDGFVRISEDLLKKLLTNHS